MGPFLFSIWKNELIIYMELRTEILNKVLNEDGTLVWKFSKTASVQKYLTPEEISFLKEKCFGNTFSEKYFCLKNNITENPKCICGKPLKFLSYKAGYQKYCSNTCTLKNREYKEEWKEKRKKTNIEKYGVVCSMNTPEIEEKRRQALREKYGGDSPFYDKKIRDKAHSHIDYKKQQETAKRNHGGQLNGSKETSEKIKKTLIEKYGVDHPMKLEKNKEIAAKTLIITGKNKKYYYDNTYFDSSWELIFYIYCKDHNKSISRNNRDFFEYIGTDKKKHRYYPDFIVDGNYVEIKSKYTAENDQSWIFKKAICDANNIKIYFREDLKDIFKEFYAKYNKNYLKQFQNKTDDNFKRKIIEINNSDEIKKLFEKRNTNIKIKLTCEKCGKTDYQSVRTVLHFNNSVCKRCRRKVLNLEKHTN